MTESPETVVRDRWPWKCEGCGWTNLEQVTECDGCGESLATALLSRSGALAELHALTAERDEAVRDLANAAGSDAHWHEQFCTAEARVGELEEALRPFHAYVEVFRDTRLTNTGFGRLRDNLHPLLCNAYDVLLASEKTCRPATGETKR